MRWPLAGVVFGVALGAGALAAGLWSAVLARIPDVSLGRLTDDGVLPLEYPPPPPPGWDISNIDHPRVDYWVGRFESDRRDRLSGFLQRKGRYDGMISKALRERGMPQDLVYLAMVESGFQPKAYSHAHASGLWQFIPGTATRYGLVINRAVDERNDPVKSTDAALRYLKDLHDEFGSWYLAAAAYNTGENRVRRILRAATGRGHGTDVDYYRIWQQLPAETREYVPLMIASARIGKDQARYGFAAEPWKAHDYHEITAPPSTPLKSVAVKAGTTVARLRELNPHLKLDRTRSDVAMQLRVPVPSPEPVPAD